MEPSILITEIEKILGKTLHPAPARGEDVVSGVMPVSERAPFRYALDKNTVVGLNLAGAKLTDAKWQKICKLLGSDIARMEALNLRDNKLKTSPVPAEMKNLRYLDLCGNQIQEVVLPGGAGKLEHVWLYGNKGLATPPLEIVSQGNNALLDYFRKLEEQGGEKIKEAKLLILGEGGAGKTTLARKILKGFGASLPTEKESTHGIEIHDHVFTSLDGKDFAMHVWDFGGQEIYHATHQFFLTKRSLYVLVADVRKEDVNFDYWLQVVELLSDKSPVIIVQNQRGGRTKDIDLTGLRGRFANLKEVISLDLSVDEAKFGKLLRKIETEIQELDHINTLWPGAWAAVRRELETRKQSERPDLPLNEYLLLCEKQEMDEVEALRLSQFLHDFGVFLHFQDDVLLKRTVFLNNDWVTKGVYAVLDDPQVIEAKGYFSIEEAKNIWKNPAYRRMSDELLQLMNKFELCFRLPDERGEERYLTPHLLSAQTPNLQWDDHGNLELRYHYDFMPKGLLSRLIVRLHRYLPNPEQEAWRTGAVFHRQGAQAKLVETYGTRNLFLRAKGAEAKGLVTLISDEIDHLNKGYYRLQVKKLVPCNCPVCRKLEEPNFYEFEDLMRRKERGKKTVECKNSYEDVNVLRLIDDVFVTTFFVEQPKKVFISYSKSDKVYLEQLKSMLSPLVRDGLLQPWDDTKLLPGEEWNASIRRELNTADIILLLVSSDLMATDYVWDIEMKEALARHERGDAVVVPIIIRPSLWKDAPFAKLNALPEKGKAISTWDNPDEAWVEVGEKLKEIAERKKYSRL
ncbi:MAG: COR domain-containing protein [Saprospiraceae bacterium]